MAQVYNYPPETPKKSNNNTVLIIVIVALVLLCCCCVGISAAVYLWNNGDQIFGLTSQFSQYLL